MTQNEYTECLTHLEAAAEHIDRLAVMIQMDLFASPQGNRLGLRHAPEVVIAAIENLRRQLSDYVQGN